MLQAAGGVIYHDIWSEYMGGPVTITLDGTAVGGDIDLPDAYCTCTLAGVTISGHVKVGPHSTLAITGGVIHQDVQAQQGAAAVTINGAQVGGSVQVQNSGDVGMIGANINGNTAIHAANRIFVDRAFVGKIQAAYQAPSTWGGFEVASVADYLDGLVFARQLLVTGLPQGPFLVATTVRGSPEGGNRAQYAINWNLRVSRQFGIPAGRLTVIVDILNVINAAQRLQESDLSSPSFNLRLPVSIQPPRSVRLSFLYDF